MKIQVNLKNYGADIFYSYLYPIYAKEFLFGSNYEKFAKLIQERFILTPEQWEFILLHWEDKERILDQLLK